MPIGKNSDYLRKDIFCFILEAELTAYPSTGDDWTRDIDQKFSLLLPRTLSLVFLGQQADSLGSGNRGAEIRVAMGPLQPCRGEAPRAQGIREGGDDTDPIPLPSQASENPEQTSISARSCPAPGWVGGES